MALGAQLGHRIAGGVQFIRARGGRVGRFVFVDGVRRQAGTLAPDFVEQVEIGAQVNIAR
jgi:hypothetical protein